MGGYLYTQNCVGFQGDVNDLIWMIDNGIEITRATFLKHVNRASLRAQEKELGYDAHHRQGLTMAGDYHVSYHRSKLRGKRVYYFKHSAIENIFEKT